MSTLGHANVLVNSAHERAIATHPRYGVARPDTVSQWRAQPPYGISASHLVCGYAHSKPRLALRRINTQTSIGTITVRSIPEQQQMPTKTDALIIGGGPAGLAAAVMLAARGYQVTVAEKHSDVAYSDPDRSYVYAIDGRGRQFTDRYGITAQIADASVGAKSVTMKRVLANGKTVSSKQVIKDEARIVNWLPRSSFMCILESAAVEGPHSQHINILKDTEAVTIERSSGRTISSSSSAVGVQQLTVRLHDTATGEVTTYAPQLLLGCDGINSIVRSSLQGWAAEQASSSGSSKTGSSSSSSPRFGMVQYPSLSTNLRFKVLQLPPNPKLADGTALPNPDFCLLTGKVATAIGGPPLRLGLLPIKVTSVGRSANLITLPDHPIWNVQDAETMYTVCSQAFPQVAWRAVVPEETMARFAASRGGQFPAPQYSNGLAMVLSSTPQGPAAAAAAAAVQPLVIGNAAAVKGVGVVLLGDAAHCFPPDLGQGVNSALEDVCVLEQQLEAANDDLTQALPAFEQCRLPDSAALAKLVQIGYPLQYNQYPLLRTLWTAGFLGQMLLNKVLPFLVSPPLFLMIQDPAQSYSKVLAATQRSRNAVMVSAAALVALLAWLLQKIAGTILQRLATGSA